MRGGAQGLLFHRCRLAEQGPILAATIAPPNSQNEPAIEADLRRLGHQGPGRTARAPSLEDEDVSTSRLLST